MTEMTLANWATEPCDRHLLTCCADCLSLARMRRDADGNVAYKADCAVQSYVEITGESYDAAAELFRSLGFRPGGGTPVERIRKAFEAVGFKFAEVFQVRGAGNSTFEWALHASRTDGRMYVVCGWKGKKAHAWTIIDGKESRQFRPPYRYRLFEVTA